MNVTEFNGFPREMPDFLFRLRFNNTIEKQAENIAIYRELVTKPLTDLYEALLPEVLKISSRLDTGRSRCVSTPYTDRRFAKNVPLKEYMYIRFKCGGGKTDIPGLYFDMGCDYYSYGLRIYKQTSHGSDMLRCAISDATDVYSEAIDCTLKQGFKIIGDKYKTGKYPSLPQSSAKELLNHKNYYIAKTVPLNDNIFTSALASELKQGFTAVGRTLNLICEAKNNAGSN
jgi:uncharacterized protein (DUF2461 family)